MPYRTEKIAINNVFIDKRSKLIPCQKERIYKMYHQDGGFSQRELAKMFNVSRRTIVFILYPERLEKNQADFYKRQKDGRYYNKDKHKMYMQKHRRRKHQILKDTITPT